MSPQFNLKSTSRVRSNETLMLVPITLDVKSRVRVVFPGQDPR
jgi:hypothetical protein